MSYSIVQGTLDPSMPMAISAGDDTYALDPETDTVVFKYKDPNGEVHEVELDLETPYVEDPPEGELVDAAAGQLRRIWVAGETDTPGIYEGRLFVTRNGRPRAFPNDTLPFVWTVEPDF